MFFYTVPKNSDSDNTSERFTLLVFRCQYWVTENGVQSIGWCHLCSSSSCFLEQQDLHLPLIAFPNFVVYCYSIQKKKRSQAQLHYGVKPHSEIQSLVPPDFSKHGFSEVVALVLVKSCHPVSRCCYCSCLTHRCLSFCFNPPPLPLPSQQQSCGAAVPSTRLSRRGTYRGAG